MKKFVRNTIVMLFAIIFVNSVSAQVGTKPHANKTIKVVVVNDKTSAIWVERHSNLKEKSGIKGQTEIKPGDSKSFEVFPDSILVKGKARARLAFRLTNDKTNKSAGQNYLLVFSKVKTTIHVANTKIEAESYISDPTTEQGIGFKTNEMINNTTVCILKNESSVSITFTNPGHPFFGKTLASKDSMNLNATQKKQLVSTGFKTSEMLIIRKDGKEPIKIVRTLPICESSTVVPLTDEFFDLSIRSTSSKKVYPMKIRTDSPIDITIDGAYNSKGKETVYIIPGGDEGEKGKIIYLKYGENEVNLKYDYRQETPQTLIIRADERGVKYLKFQTSGPLKGKFLVDVMN